VGATSPLPYGTPYAETFTLCEHVFLIGFPLGLYVPKNGVFEGFESEDVNILCSDPQKALPYVNTRLLVYRV